MQKCTFEVRGSVSAILLFFNTFFKSVSFVNSFFRHFNYIIYKWPCYLTFNSSVTRNSKNLRSAKTKTYSFKKFIQLFFFHFIGCRPGYNGVNCSQLCPYPYYGVYCQRKCNCSKTLCDVFIGCIRIVEGEYKK